MTLTIRTDRQLIRAGASSTRFVMVSFVAREVPARAGRLPVNVALILDRSGSMAGARKFDMAREAVEQALRMLHAEDRFSLVVYDDRVDLLMASSKATPDARRRALDVLSEIEPGETTDLCAGWMRGCEQIAEHLREEGVARALLLTDGLANRGVTDRETLVRHAAELRARGIATSTFGVGADFDEILLRDMAHEGGGNFYFIETSAQIPDLLTSELGEALEVVMRGAALEIALPRGADAELLNRFRSRRAHGDTQLRVELGDLVSGQDVRAVVQVTFAPGEIGERSTARIALVADGRNVERSEGIVTWTYASDAANDEQRRDVEVDRAVATLSAARARAEATELNRHGHLSLAGNVLRQQSLALGQYAGDDEFLNVLREEVDADVARFAREMSPLELKLETAIEEALQMGRDAQGKAKRRHATRAEVDRRPGDTARPGDGPASS